MNESPDREDAELERRVHRVLRAQPLRRAPVTLQQRVLDALRTQPALPWWRRSLLHWPRPAQALFALTAAGAAYLSTQVMGWCSMRLDANPVTSLVQMLGHNIPTAWLYAAGFAIATLYAAGLGLGAIAWRTLFTNRQSMDSNS
ncbi:MAG TPA: hypothetical protein VMI92_05140 [Steroidobacteraceae bacterium]|nr:hypothetical protein [Steroidobacteraceae bacterium]